MLESAGSGKLLSHRLAVGFFIFAFIYLVYASSIKNMGLYVWDYDTRCWYTGGVCWWNGDSPHDKEIFTQTWTDIYGSPPNRKATFVYPPTMAIISLPLALLPWPVAAWTFRIVSIMAFLGICYFSRRLMAARSGVLRFDGPTGWYVGLTPFLGSVIQGINQGQCALIVVCGCLAAWHGFQKKVLWLFLLGFIVASIKPQISMIPLLYIFLVGGYRWFIYGSLASGAISLVMLLAVPQPDLVSTYQGSLDDHLKHQFFNQWDWYCGVPALLGATSAGKQFALAGIAAGVVGGAWLVWRQRLHPNTLRNRLRHQQMIWVVAMAAMPIHIYDLTGQIFLTITLWVLPDWRCRVAAFTCMFLGDKAYQIADKLEHMGGVIGSMEPVVRAQGMSVASLVLLCLYFYWYWRDYGRPIGTRSR